MTSLSLFVVCVFISFMVIYVFANGYISKFKLSLFGPSINNRFNCNNLFLFFFSLMETNKIMQSGKKTKTIDLFNEKVKSRLQICFLVICSLPLACKWLKLLSLCLQICYMIIFVCAQCFVILVST